MARETWAEIAQIIDAELRFKSIHGGADNAGTIGGGV